MMEPVSAGPNGRSPEGRFAPGNRLGRGNPNSLRMSQLRAALLEAATPEHVVAVYGVTLRAALEGDTQASRLILEYLLGKPTQAMELSGPDGEPLGGDLGKLQGIIMGALDRFPEARLAVAASLRAVRDGAEDQKGAGP